MKSDNNKQICIRFDYNNHNFFYLIGKTDNINQMKAIPERKH